MDKWQEAPRIGFIPDDWNWDIFDNVIEWSQYGVTATSDENGTYPMLRMGDLVDGKIDTSNLVYINLETEEFQKYKLCKDDLLVNRTNSYDLVGKTSLFELSGNYVCASYIVRFRLDKNKVDPKFVNYFFNSYIGQNKLRVLATKGVSQANINPTTLKRRYTIPLPPLAEQRAIARILGTWDEAIALIQSLIEALQQRKKGLMQKLLTGEVRFPGFDDEWEEVRLGDMFNERKERGFEHLPLVSITNSDGIVFRDELDRRDTSSADKSKYLHIAPGDIGYNTMRMWQGVSGVSEIEGIVSPAYTILKPKEELDVNFIGYLFQLQSSIYLFWRYSQGLVDDTLNLKFPSFSVIRMAIPEKAEQTTIANILKACDELISSYQDYVYQLQEQKKGLMQQLLTGYMRVKVEE